MRSRLSEWPAIAETPLQRHISCEARSGDHILQYCNYTTPNGFQFKIMENGILISTARSSNDSSITPMNSTILELAVIKVKFSVLWTMPPRIAEITECELRWCATTFLNTSVINGTFHPGPTHTTELTITDTERWFASSYKFEAVNDEQRTITLSKDFLRKRSRQIAIIQLA